MPLLSGRATCQTRGSPPSLRPKPTRPLGPLLPPPRASARETVDFAVTGRPGKQRGQVPPFPGVGTSVRRHAPQPEGEGRLPAVPGRPRGRHERVREPLGSARAGRIETSTPIQRHQRPAVPPDAAPVIRTSPANNRLGLALLDDRPRLLRLRADGGGSRRAKAQASPRRNWWFSRRAATSARPPRLAPVPTLAPPPPPPPTTARRQRREHPHLPHRRPS